MKTTTMKLNEDDLKILFKALFHLLSRGDELSLEELAHHRRMHRRIAHACDRICEDNIFRG